MPVDFNAGNTTELQTSFGDNPIGNDASIKTSKPIQNGTDIQIMEAVGSADLRHYQRPHKKR